jgi:hypothetical protein
MALASTSRVAWADDAEAERLTKEGQDLLEHGQVNEACDKFDLSLKHAENLNTMALLAFCHERAGKPGRAWNEFKRIEPRVPTGEKAAFVAQHLRALDGKVARARLDVGNRTISEVRIDNEVVLLDQGRIVADPGEHTIRVEAGGRTLTRNASLRAGDNAAIVMSDTSPPSSPSETSETPPPPTESGGSSTLGWVLTGLGAGFLGVGIYEGVNTLSIKKDADNICGASAPTCTSPAAEASAASRKHDAVVPSWLATGGLALGLAGLGTGIYLLVTQPSPARAGTLQVRPLVGAGVVGVMGSL